MSADSEDEEQPEIDKPDVPLAVAAHDFVLTPYVRDLLDGKLGLPRLHDRLEQAKRFLALKDVPGIKRRQICRWCSISDSTCKRWQKQGPVDHRLSKEEQRKSLQVAMAKAKEKLETQNERAPGKKAKPGTVASILRKSDVELEKDFAGVQIWADFDAIKLLKKVCCSKRVPPQIKVTAARAVAAIENVKGRIPWETLAVEQIPVEVQHRLAGLLLHLVAWDELPEAVRAASPVRRRVYRLLGVLPDTEAAAEQTLARWAGMRAELVAELVPVDPVVAATPLVLSLAVEHGSRKR